MNLDEALKARKSVRAFKPDPVPLDLVKEILELARLSPSGTNIQPWTAHVVSAEVRPRLHEAVLPHWYTHHTDPYAPFPIVSNRKDSYTTRMRTLANPMHVYIAIPADHYDADAQHGALTSRS